MSPEVREKGRLEVRKVKSGKFRGQVFLESKGKRTYISLSPYEFKDDSLNGVECEVERLGGNVERLFIDGKEYPRKVSAEPPSRSQQKQGSPQERHVGGGYGGKATSGGGGYSDQWSIENTKLPGDTRKLIKNQSDIENYYLLLNKAAQYIEGKFKFFLHERPRKGGQGKELKVYPNGYGGIDFEALANRADNCRDAAKEYELVKIGDLRPEWRLVIGLGSESVYETGLTLHHIYGFPYIPGSAIKGVTRHHVVTSFLAELFQKDDLGVLDKTIDVAELDNLKKEYRSANAETVKKELRSALTVTRSDGDNAKNSKPVVPTDELVEKLLEGWDELETVRDIFGNQANKGKVIFLDAYPTKPPTIKADIVNPHFPDYYREMGRKPPVDSMNPIPVNFLAVEDTPFRFAIMARLENRALLEKPFGGKTISSWVRAAIIEHGIGAKTSVGYGYFEDT